MKKNLQWKVALVLVVIAGSIFLAYPFNDTKIKRGLDLKGGIHLVLKVLTDDSINMETDQEVARLEDLLKKNSVTFQKITKEGLGRIAVQGTLADQESKTRDLFDEYTRDWDYSFTGDRANLTLKPLVTQFLRDQSVEQAKQTIDNRINTFGVAEPLIQRQGTDKIVVELPGVDDPDRVKELIKVTAVLEWKLVKAGPAADEATLLQATNGQVPDDAEVLKGDPKRGQGGYYLVDKVATVTGKDLRTIRRTQDEWNNPAVAFSLNADGGARFEQVTGANIGKQIAIILDKKVQSAPVVEDRISRAIAVVEVPGEHAGWLALQAGIAACADAALIPDILYEYPGGGGAAGEERNCRACGTGWWSWPRAPRRGRNSRRRARATRAGRSGPRCRREATGEAGRHVIESLGRRGAGRGPRVAEADRPRGDPRSCWATSSGAGRRPRWTGSSGLGYGAGAVRALQAGRVGTMVLWVLAAGAGVRPAGRRDQQGAGRWPPDSMFMQIARSLGIYRGGRRGAAVIAPAPGAGEVRGASC